MDRRAFLAGLSASLPVVYAAHPVAAGGATREDIPEDCKGAADALKGWVHALARRDFDYLERHLADDFVFTGPPLPKAGGKVMGGLKNKPDFIEQDRKIYNTDIKFMDLTARRMGDLVITVVFALVNEEFRGDLGPTMPSAEQMTRMMTDIKMGYASGWRYIDDRWQCTSHHILGIVEAD